MKRFKPARKESVYYANISLLIMGALYILIYFLNKNGFGQVHTESQSFFIHFFSIIGVILLNDAYFYWVHFALHRVSFLKKYHHIHHQDTTPTPISSFCFHPVEAILNFSFYVFVALLIPIHQIDFYIVYIYMLVNNSMGHTPIEFCPRWFYKYKISSFLNAATHHIMHHRNGSTNFSLYYLIWDKLMGTISSKYYKTFNEVHDNIEAK